VIISITTVLDDASINTRILLDLDVRTTQNPEAKYCSTHLPANDKRYLRMT